MNELHKGFVLDGYYEYEDGLGAFLKEESARSTGGASQWWYFCSSATSY